MDNHSKWVSLRHNLPTVLEAVLPITVFQDEQLPLTTAVTKMSSGCQKWKTTQSIPMRSISLKAFLVSTSEKPQLSVDKLAPQLA